MGLPVNSIAKPLTTSALAALFSLAMSPLAGAQISFSDDFNDRTVTQERIGNDWTWYDTAYDAGCSAATGGFGPYSDGGGGFANYVHLNNNYARLDGGAGHDGSGYYRAGLAGADGAASLEVYQSQYATNPCNEIKIFQEFPDGEPGDYTFTATVIGNEFTPISAGSSVGVFMKVLDVDADYSEAQFVKVPITPPAFDAGAADVTFNFTVNSDVVKRIVQVGMYAQHPNGGTASAIWDDVSVAVASAGGGGSGSGSGSGLAPPAAIPTLPVWGLFALAGLLGLMGYRRKK